MRSYEAIFARSFSKDEQKRLGRGALIACCIMALTLCTVFKPYLARFPAAAAAVNLALPISAAELKILRSTEEEISLPNQSSVGFDDVGDLDLPVIHNITSTRSQVYELNGDLRIHGNSSTIFISSSSASAARPSQSASWIIKPYARSVDRVAMQKVRGFQVVFRSPDAVPRCVQNFSLPAVVFSSGGYAGNPFHDFTDILIPLYLTSRQFNGSVLFLLADKRSWWTSKYNLILEKLSKYDVMDIDNVNQVLCFPQMIVGLRAHKELSADPSKSPNYSARDFTNFLRSTYSLNRHQLQMTRTFRVEGEKGGPQRHCRTRQRRPRLLIVSRKKTRRLTNTAEVAKLGRSLGFEVTVSEMGWQVSAVARQVNSFDVMVGVHGAGLTNMVFLPENAVVIQIVPIRVETLAKHYFEGPAKDMGLRYMEYRVRVNESSLTMQESQAEVDAKSGGWPAFRAVYLDRQDIRLDVGRFRGTLSKARELVAAC